MKDSYPHILLISLVVIAVWSTIAPYDRATWWMETIPGFAGMIILALTFKKFPLTPVVYTFIALHIVILLVGGHYTYARVPLGEWARDAFHLGRNHFDRLGHFAQGFVPAMIARELLIRKRIVRTAAWRFFIILSICLAISACYELVEWAAALSMGQGADEFLATQGDIWDTQEDMATALVGATCALIIMAPMHDAQLKKMGFEL